MSLFFPKSWVTHNLHEGEGHKNINLIEVIISLDGIFS